MVAGVIILVVMILMVVFLAKRVKSARQMFDDIQVAESPLEADQQVDPSVPDKPHGFGYKNKWFAVKGADVPEIAAMLGIKKLASCNWAAGIKNAYKSDMFSSNIFITPPVDGWTLICGWGLPDGDTPESIEEVKALLKKLSEKFQQAQFFASHRVSEFHCWMRAANGIVERIYVYVADYGNIKIEGAATAAEKAYNLPDTLSEEGKSEGYYEREDIKWPNEEMVTEIAGQWSVDPSMLDDREELNPSLGWSGRR